MQLRKAVFLDRDDTIIRDKVDLFRPEEVEYFPDTFQALKLMAEKGYDLFMVTNQSGIARGLFTGEDVMAVYQKIQEDLARNGAPPFKDIRFSPARRGDPHTTTRKPLPGMLHHLAEQWQIDLKASYMIGDKISDAECGWNAGATGALLGQKESDERFDNFTDLLDFAGNLR